MEDTAYVQLRGIRKSFGSVVANDGIDLDLRKGEIMALLGENGSGKSTLMNILSGIYSPDGGRITVGGKEHVFSSPADSIAAGIGMVYQHFKLVDVFTAKENIIAGRRGSFLTRGKGTARSLAGLAERYGLSFDPDKKVYNMSVGEKQAVEILKVLHRGADVLILDEPTAVLTPQEIRSLFAILRNLKRSGCAVVIITHKLNEVLEISDRVTILRKGRCVGTVMTAQTDAGALTEAMVGKPISLSIERPETDPKLVRPILSVEGLTVLNGEKRRALDGVSFALNSGEILGFAGIAGSGQKELCEAIYGMTPAESGKIIFKGEDIVGKKPRDMIKLGISMSFVPEDRLGMGLVAGMDIADNVMLKSYRNRRGAFIDRQAGRRKAERIIREFSIDTTGPSQIVRRLSGGNIQKVLLGREIDTDPQLLITAYPSRGLDIGASYNIYDVLNGQKKKGIGILFIGEDLDVLMELCDRIAVIHGGRIMGVVKPEQTTKEKIGLMMLGRKEEEAS